jgi:hypothetical protein
MQRSATFTAPGTATSPRSHLPTVRRSTSNVSATASWVVKPAAARTALNSSGVMAHQPNLAAQTVRKKRLGHQGTVEESAVRILDSVVRQHVGQGGGGDVAFAFLPDLPTRASIHLNPNLRHASLRSYAQRMGQYVPRVNGENA